MTKINRTEEVKRLNEKKCKICNDKAYSMARGEYLCRRCFRLISRDNIKKYNRGEDITNDLTIELSCARDKRGKGRASCYNKINVKLNKDTVGKKLYCSKECEIKDNK